MDESHSELTWLRTLLHSMEDALFVHDLEGRILECNHAACTRTGYTRAELLRMRTHDLDAPEFAAEFEKRLREQLARKRYRCEGVHVTRDGALLHVDIHTTLIEYRGNPAVLAVMRDITDRKRAEQEREALRARVLQAEKLESLGVMAGGIAHDFNNLLMGVLGNASIAMLEVPDDSRARRCLEQIEAAAQRAANLSQQMLAYSGRATYTFERIDLRQLVRDASPALAGSISKRHRIEYKLDGEASIHADESQLRQALLGLVTNASEAYGERDGVIAVSVKLEHVDHYMLASGHVFGTLADGMHAVLEVSDSGCGMDAKLIARIFDPFFTTKFTGRGLGLAAVIGIVRGHRGAISVRSSLGKGSTFRIYLPAVAANATEPKRVSGVASGLAGNAVLVVDDEEVVLNVSRQGLERAGYTVFTASSGKEAIELFRERQNEIGLVILDLTMPRMSGEETFRALKGLRDDVRIAVSSGYNQSDAALRIDPASIESFLQKPYRARDLVSFVSRILDQPAALEPVQTTDFQI